MVKSMIGMIALKLFFNIFLFVLGATFIGSVMSDLREGKWPLHEWVAILYHNSPWDGVVKPAFKKNKLLTILSYADYYSSLYLEDRND